MNPRSHNLQTAFTLLELVVVLAILSIVTALAVRSLDRVDEQRRFENSQQGLEELSAAILGSPDDRQADGTRTVSGFVADMGRLPLTAGTSELTLSELWVNPGVPYDLRPATADHGVAAVDEDPQVLVPGGWRGPYLRLPVGAATLQDGWGNTISSPSTASPADPDGTGYARLRDENDQPITTAGQPVRIVRILGANGRVASGKSGYDRDEFIAFPNEKFQAELKGQVEVLNGNTPATPDATDEITVRVFSPHPTNPIQIIVSSTTVPFATNPVTWQIPMSAGVTIGPRVVRASFKDANISTSFFLKSAVKHVTLRPGMNFVELTIDR